MSAAPSPKPLTGPGLLSRSFAWIVAYWAGMALLWALGFEALYEHPTPFYALFRPVFTSPALPAVLGLITLAAYALGLRLLRGRWLSEWWAIPAGILIAIGVLSLRTFPNPRPYAWATHVLAACLAASGLIAAGWAARQAQLPARTPSPRWTCRYLMGLMLFAGLFAAAIALIRGPEGIAGPYERQTYEFVGDVGKGGSIAGLFADYNRIHPYLSMHAKVHPPGPIVLFWVLSWFTGGPSPWGLALATVALAPLALIFLYLWAKDLAGPTTALAASTLYALVPSVVLFSATSADALFPLLTLPALFLFGRALFKGHAGYAAAAGIGYALMSLTKFTLAGLGVYFAFLGLRECMRPGGLRRTVLTALVMAGAFLAFHGAVYWTTSFDYLECFRLAKAQFDTDQAGLNEMTPRYPPLWFKLLNPLCWAYFAGIPTTLLFAKRLLRPGTELRSVWWALALTLLALNFLYLGRGEGERSALYVFPFVVLPAAHLLAETCRQQRSLAPIGAAAAFLLFQSWLTESLFYTYW